MALPASVILAALLGAAPSEPAAPTPEPSKLTVQDADPLGRGAWQLQVNHASGLCTSRWEDGGELDRHPAVRESLFQAVLTLGVHDRLDLGLAMGVARLEDRGASSGPLTGRTDAAIGAKWRLGERAAGRLRWAYVPTLWIPAARPDFGSGSAWADQRVALTASGGRWTATADAGLAHGPGAGHGSWSAGAALGVEIARGLQPVVEVTWARDLAAGHEARIASLAVGLVITPGDAACIRAGHARTLRGRASPGVRGSLLSIDLNRPATAPPGPGWAPGGR